MGMFDEIRCEIPLPGSGLTDQVFQTKSFPDPCLQRYTISKDRRLIDSRGRNVEPDGYVSFYSASESDKEYRAHFSEGRLLNVLCVGGEDSSPQVYVLASFRWYAP
jgi:hypothetical protein